jgi:pimeloyl-ACP methyl ester carboxylesterase
MPAAARGRRRQTAAAIVVAGLTGLGLWLYTPDAPRAALSARYQRSPADRLEVAGAGLHVRDDGPRDAPAILLLHGFGASLHTWEPWATDLQRDHRVVRLDLPGFGLSDPEPEGDYSDERGVAILVALLDALGIDRTTVVGNSLGGRLAWRLAAAHPDRVSRLVLISPDGFASPGFEYDRPAEVPASLQLMRFVLPAPLVRMSIEPAYADPSRLSDETVTRYRDLMLAPGIRGAMLERMATTVLVRPEPLLARITAPTLLMWGELDQMIPVRNAQDYLAVLPDARLVVFPDLGHVPHEEEPARALQALRAFLAGAAAPPAATPPVP